MDVSDAAIYNTQVTHKHSTNNTLQKDTTNDTYYIEQEFHLPAKKIKLTNIDTSIISEPITINQALINQNGQFLPSDFNIQTGNLNPIDPVTGQRVQSNAEYISSIDVTVPDMQLDSNQSPITENRDYVMYDMERNDTLDVVPQNEQPQQQQRSLVLKASTRDATDDQTYRKIGVLNVNVQPVYQSKTVTIDNNSPSTQTINFDSPNYNALRNVTINKNITPVEIVPTYNLSNFKIRYYKGAFMTSRQNNKLKADSSMTLITPSWIKVTNLNHWIDVYSGSNLVLINKIGTNLWSLEIVDYGNDLDYSLSAGVTESYYFNYNFGGIGTSQNFLTYETGTNIETLLKYSCNWSNGQGDCVLSTTIKKFILNIDQSV